MFSRTIQNYAEIKPNLLFRKAKMAKKSVEKYKAKKIEIPEIKGEALFGLHAVLEAIRSGKRDFHSIYLKKAIEDSDTRIREILQIIQELGIKKESLTDDQLDRLTEYQLHNGICMDASPLNFSNFETKNFSIFVDRVLDPGNLGAIGRSAWYFGADGICLVKGRGPKTITPSMIKSSCGALEHLPVQQFENFHEFRDSIKLNSGELVATCDPLAAEKAGITVKSLNEWKPKKTVGIVLGDEGVGISKEILNFCDTVISIAPTREHQSSVTSLNVSVVAAVENNTTDEYCSNGVRAGNLCQLIPSSGYECSSFNSSASWCESFNGKYKCCEKSTIKCKDRSSFCRLTKKLCLNESDFGKMKAKCEATCGFCGFKTFEEVEKTRKRIDELARGQECDLPRKCVFPKEKMLNSTGTPSVNHGTTATIVDPIVACRSKLNWNSTTVGSAKNVTEYNNSTEFPMTSNETSNITTVDLKTLLQTVGKLTTSTTLRSSTTRSRIPKTIDSFDSNEKLKTFASRRHNETTTSITLPSSFNSTKVVRKLTLEELKTTRDTMPKITTAEPSSLSNSLSKTVIRGTCFDEYTYCREFTSLCSHPAFSEVMASHCSLTCDRCDDVERVEEGSEDCEDMTPDCKNYRDLCQHSKYKTLMKSYCPKVCGHCIPMCRDRHQNCPQFFDDGFCNDTMYTYDERKYLCGATCLLC
ncbi:hypothetical protein CRE_04820 [Caenorhabditis remanei]|uniref:rRNA methyltransferase 1, mitochondrial n=1 Tax=Caenorhabditis remanei TaxID=31234 RepID=E3LZE6_CAERE|nr:hypothetical protein CRE_04820 [Caenorhabditis remanei]